MFAARTDHLESSPLYPLTSAARVATGMGRNPLRRLALFEPDVVHVHNLFPNWGTRWLRSVRRPLVVTLHNYRIICAKGTLFRDGRICTACPDGTPMSAVRYGCYRGSRVATIPLAVANRRDLLEHPVVSSAKMVIVLNEVAREVYTRYGIPKDRLVVWPNFVGAEDDPGWSPVPSPESEWLYVGRLSEEKGILRLARAWPSDTPMLIIGDGPQRAAIEGAARSKRIRVLGLQPTEVVRASMQSAVGLVFPSTCFENFPMVYAEAMASGLPVLAWEPNVVAAMVSQHGTGAVTTWDDDVAQRVAGSSTVFRELRGHCRRVFDHLLSEEAYVRRAEDLYGGLMAARGDASGRPPSATTPPAA